MYLALYHATLSNVQACYGLRDLFCCLGALGSRREPCQDCSWEAGNVLEMYKSKKGRGDWKSNCCGNVVKTEQEVGRNEGVETR